MKRNGRRRANELVDRRAVFQLLVNAARLARPRVAREPRPARAYAPRGHSHFERLRLGGEILDLHASTPQLPPQMFVIFIQQSFAFLFCSAMKELLIANVVL